MSCIRPVLLCIAASFLSLAGCGTAAPADPIPKHDEFKIESSVLSETRHINVYVPASYETSADPLPVVYMPDGGLQEDFPHIANSIDALISSGQIAPVILVGIENAERRRDLSGPTTVESDRQIAPRVGGAAKFRDFIRTELIPEIHKRYRCTDDSAIIGESLAGLFIVETLLLEPTLFDRYIAMDPSLWWNNHQLVTNAASKLKEFDSSERHFWFASSDATDIHVHTKQLASVLTSENTPGVVWTYEDRPGEKHNTIYRATKEEALRWALWKSTK